MTISNKTAPWIDMYVDLNVSASGDDDGKYSISLIMIQNFDVVLISLNSYIQPTLSERDDLDVVGATIRALIVLDS